MRSSDEKTIYFSIPSGVCDVEYGELLRIRRNIRPKKSFTEGLIFRERIQLLKGAIFNLGIRRSASEDNKNDNTIKSKRFSLVDGNINYIYIAQFVSLIPQVLFSLKPLFNYMMSASSFTDTLVRSLLLTIPPIASTYSGLTLFDSISDIRDRYQQAKIFACSDEHGREKIIDDILRFCQRYPGYGIASSFLESGIQANGRPRDPKAYRVNTAQMQNQAFIPPPPPSVPPPPPSVPPPLSF